MCYEGRRGRRFHKGHFGYRKWQKGLGVEMAQFLHEPSKNGTVSGPREPTAPGDLLGPYPAIWEYLSETAWESGKTRETSTLLIFIEDGLVKCCLRDRAAGRTTWSSGEVLEDVLAGLNMVLEKGTAEWRKEKAFKR